MTPIHFGTKRRFWLLRAFGALVMAALSALMLDSAVASVGLKSAGGVMGLLGLTFFGVGAVVGLVEGTRRGPRLTLDAEGVHDRTLGVGVIPWADILGAAPYGVAQQPFVALDLREPARYIARATWKRRLFARLNAASGLPPFSVNLVGLDADPMQVAKLIVFRCMPYQPPDDATHG